MQLWTARSDPRTLADSGTLSIVSGCVTCSALCDLGRVITASRVRSLHKGWHEEGEESRYV